MAADYLKLGFSDALAKALERRDQRNARFGANIDTTLNGLGEATKAALQQRQRNKILAEYGGDENDAELKVAKEAYRTSGDPSLLIQYEQNRKQDALTKRANEIAAAREANTIASNKIEQQKVSNQRRNELVGNVNRAIAAYKDASIGGAKPSNAISTNLDESLKALELEFPGESEKFVIPSAEEIPQGENKPNLQDLRHTFEKKITKSLNSRMMLDQREREDLLKDLDALHDAGLDLNTYRAFYREISDYNPSIQKAEEAAVEAAETKKETQITRQNAKTDRAKALAKEAKVEAEEQKKKDDERKKGQSWIDARDDLSEEELKQSLSFASADIQAAVKAIKGW